MVSLSTVNAFLIFGLVLFILLIAFLSRRNQEFFFGAIYRIQQATSSGTTDSFNVDMFDLYISNGSNNITLTIPSSPLNIVGRTLVVKNNSTGTITLQAGTGVNITASVGCDLQLSPGDYRELLVNTSPNNFICLLGLNG